jgi:hypothetical protein
MKSLGTLVIAALVALILGAVGAYAMASSIDRSPANSDTGAAEQVDESQLLPEVYGTK